MAKSERPKLSEDVVSRQPLRVHVMAADRANSSFPLRPYVQAAEEGLLSSTMRPGTLVIPVHPSQIGDINLPSKSLS